MPRPKIHGDRSNGQWTPEYNTWRGMKARCRNPKQKDYPDYGGRGIQVGAEFEKFSDFLAKVGRRPKKGWTLDRIDPNGNYEPGNVQWAPKEWQARNTRRAKDKFGKDDDMPF